MDGFTLTCVGSDGIRLTDFSASVTSGTIEGCSDSVRLVDDGSHLVIDIEIINPESAGIRINSNNNFISDNQIQSNTPDSTYGIQLEDADSNQIIGNTIDGLDRFGVLVDGFSNNVSGNTITNTVDGWGIFINNGGEFNLVISNIVDQSADAGIFVEANSNLISQNVVTDSLSGITIDNADSNTVTVNSVSNNADYGISIEGANSDGNSILSNSSLDNGVFDLYSPDDPTCTANTWIGNTFITSDPTCLN